MKKVLALILLLPTLAWGASLPINPAGCDNLESDQYSCTKLVYDLTGSQKGQDDVRSCPDDRTYGFSCKFQWPTSNPAQVTPVIFWNTGTDGGLGAVCWEVAIGCVSTAQEYNTFPYGSTVRASSSTGLTSTTMTPSALGSVTPYQGASNAVCRMKVYRRYGQVGCTNTLIGAARPLWIQLNY